MASSVFAIGLGAALGALLRWALSLRLNGLWPALPLGTLAANLVGGYLVGVAVGVFAQHPGLSPLWRLFLVTGFLGGLTTFSTFSAEVVDALTDGRTGAAVLAVALHLGGSLALTLLGIATVGLWRGVSASG
ncbi:fluoride efflux transporter CrcB [Aquabacterium sp. J223]|uniref:fluoride efflux transporter CrcB n=1 Tax=Aquabacterium sp. J223 TaxID=2898431 RepID=UPI0021AE1984|nr:fluoride efflux transporter CrcB [Aquabacterium sp. J223]UUX95735.1 fluoride efflux transporter CrcB [Aquabacterium sp. J223]